MFGFGGFEGLQVSFVIGAFPFSFFATAFNIGGQATRTPGARKTYPKLNL